MLILLRSCHQVIRCDPPSLLRVTLQATAVYMFSIIVFFIHFFFIGRAGYLYEAANFISSMIVTFLLPILFFLNVWITIMCRGYMKSVTGRMRQLVSHSIIPNISYFQDTKHSLNFFFCEYIQILGMVLLPNCVCILHCLVSGNVFY
jgi:hypothetical protein